MLRKLNKSWTRASRAQRFSLSVPISLSTGSSLNEKGKNLKERSNVRFFFFLQKELLKEDAVDLSCCCETSQELLGATFPAGAGHGRAGGLRQGCGAVQGRDSHPAWSCSCLCLGHYLHLLCAAQPCPQPTGTAATGVILHGINLGCSDC